MTFTDTLSEQTGIPESSLRLLFTIIFAYPIAVIYRIFLLRPIASKYAASIRQWYILITGLSLSYFYNRHDIIHSLITTTVTWIFCYIGDKIGSRSLGTAAVFIFNMVYLLLGYIYMSTDEYDVNWTMTQCVLCLRMIGFAMDYMDGAKLINKKASTETAQREKTTPNDQPVSTTRLAKQPKLPISFQKNIALPTLPSYISTIAYAHFFTAFLTGPQFSYHLYQTFINMRSYPDPSRIPRGSYKHAFQCIAGGAIYLLVSQIGQMFFPQYVLVSEEFAKWDTLHRFVYFWMVGKFAFSKYLGVWKLVEGSCALLGISFNGFDDNGQPEWNGLANVESLRFEFATSLNDIISSFNINTNLWAKIYVFKRLIFLNSKTISSLGVLFFLALWHGLHTGYFMCFFLEFVDMEAEKRWSKRVEFIKKSLYEKKMKNGISGKLAWGAYRVVCWFLQTCALHYAMVAFDLLRYEWCITAWRNVYFAGHFVVFGLIFLDLVLPKGRSAGPRKVEGKQQEETALLKDTMEKAKTNGISNGVNAEYSVHHKKE
ncbi:5216_t:CDS:2 [Paraglomus occultum]|uniref:Lysophospholipid acyltransferase 5 n=1 Tax=Paraglomus occultum TaxID=144539 RepID=A0A9N9CQE9_9GLOM|nr:5216_t:CDS:2 [Paraglomus occultum]